MPEESPYLFEVETPLGFIVRTTPSYWVFIEGKHPEIENRREELQACLRSPQMIRQSTQDKSVYLFYAERRPYHWCVVVKRTGDTGFVVTCYLTDKIKEGIAIWPTSG